MSPLGSTALPAPCLSPASFRSPSYSFTHTVISRHLTPQLIKNGQRKCFYLLHETVAHLQIPQTQRPTFLLCLFSANRLIAANKRASNEVCCFVELVVTMTTRDLPSPLTDMRNMFIFYSRSFKCTLCY